MSQHKRPAKKATPTNQVQETLDKFKPLLNDTDYHSLIEEIGSPLRQAIRINVLKTDPAGELSRLANRYQWKFEPVPYCPTGFWLDMGKNPGQVLEHRTGRFYIQDAASMLPVELFDPKPEENPLVLDMAASPGGKTTHLADRLGDQGLIIANDSSKDRLQALRTVLQNWGTTNTGVSNFPGEKFGQWFPETFDMVLLDAPCSMQNLRPTDAHPMRWISTNEQQNLSMRQTRLLSSALRAVKTGGQVVYSTCTLSPEEDEQVLEAVLQEFGSQIEIVDVSKKAIAPALTEFNGKILSPEVANGLRFWPFRYHTSGFFAALIKKKGEIGTNSLPAPDRAIENAGFFPLSEKEMIQLFTAMNDQHQVQLEQLSAIAKCVLYRRDKKILALPKRYFDHFSGFPVQYLGITIGEWQNDSDFTPTHEFVSRFSDVFQSGSIQMPEEFQAAWLKGEDIVSDFIASRNGSSAVFFDGEMRYFGIGKISGKRIKNLLPRRIVC